MPIATLSNFDCHYLQLAPKNESNSLAKRPQDIVMIHGLATSLAFWYPVATVLAQRFRVTLFDLRGHGNSSMPPTGYTCRTMAADLADLLMFLGIQQSVLISHSFGGGVALCYAQDYPEAVQQLVLADVRLKVLQPRQQVSDWSNWNQIAPLLANLGIVIQETETEAGYRLLTEMAHLQIKQPEALKPLAILFPQFSSTRTAIQWLKLIETTQAWQDFQNSLDLTLSKLKQLQFPSLAIYGELSPTLPTAYALQSVWPCLRLELVPGAGHFFPISQPQSFLQSVRNFLNGNE